MVEREVELLAEEKELQVRSRWKVHRQEGDFTGKESCPPRDEEWMHDGHLPKRSYAHTLNLSALGSGYVNQEKSQGHNGSPPFTMQYDEKGCPHITLSSEERERIRRPRKNMLIITLLGKKINYPILRRKVEQAWASTAPIQVVDVGNDYYFVRFESLDDYDFALTGGPWKIFDHYCEHHMVIRCGKIKETLT